MTTTVGVALRVAIALVVIAAYLALVVAAALADARLGLAVASLIVLYEVRGAVR